MRLFISYSRDDKAWVYELWRALRDRAHHDAWIDQRIVPAQDWWETILHHIENSECFIYVMTRKSVDSIYCEAELAYALALNKPILPLMLKPCDYPPDLKKKRIQYHTIGDDDSLGDVLFTVAQGLSEVRVNLIQNKYPGPEIAPLRPEEPSPLARPEQSFEVFMMAEEAASSDNFSLAEKLFQQVITADPKGYGQAAKDRLNEIQSERTRNAEYLQIAQMAENAALLKGARAAWRVFVQKYGNHDPENLATKLSEPTPARELAEVQQRIAQAAGAPTSPPKRPYSRVPDLLPPPFGWIDIPAGKVTLVNTWDGDSKTYLKKDQPRQFTVPAFAIAKYPVTNAQFAKFIEADGYSQKKWWTGDGWEAKSAKEWTEPRSWQDEQWNGKNQPVVGVSWYEAYAFCQWLSEASGEKITLPTEQQWQRAAQGDDGRAYPWGNEWDCKRCNNSVARCKSDRTTFVTHYEDKGDSPFGVVDMAGNVWEWCLTQYHNGSDDTNGSDVRVLRGGSWSGYSSGGFRCDNRSGDNPRGRDYDGGVRLALS